MVSAMNIFLGLLIPFLGTAAGAACVFFMKRALHDLVQRACGLCRGRYALLRSRGLRMKYRIEKMLQDGVMEMQIVKIGFGGRQ